MSYDPVDSERIKVLEEKVALLESRLDSLVEAADHLGDCVWSLHRAKGREGEHYANFEHKLPWSDDQLVNIKGWAK